MASPGKPSPQPGVPSTPGGRQRKALQPRTPGTSGAVTNCSADAKDYTIVTIHTAKCTNCDQRNMATMRRCPGCTFQLCQPCYDKRKAAEMTMAHGNMQSPATPSTPVVRRKLYGGQSKQASPLVKDAQQKNNDNAQLTTPPSKESLKRKAKAQESSDDEYVPNPSSPIPDRKRLRTGTTTRMNSGTPPVRPSQRAVSKHPSVSESLRTPSLTGDEDTTSFAGRQDKDLSPAELLEKFGVKYQEHLLGRQFPVVTNPVIDVPNNIRPDYRRPSQEEIQNNIQSKVRLKMVAARSRRQEAVPGSEFSEVANQPYTIRDFVNAEASKVKSSTSLDKDQQDTLVAAMKLAARKWSDQDYKALPDGLRRVVKPGLDREMNTIEEKKTKELTKVIDDQATRVLENEEVAFTGNATLRDTSNGPERFLH